MSTYTPYASVNPLQSLAQRASIASVLLMPPTGYTITWRQQEPTQNVTDPITAIPDGTFMPDGIFDLLITRFCTPFGLVTPLLLSVHPIEDKVESDNIPQILRDITGLPIETLASLANVSRNAYYKWLDGRGVNDEHISRLTELLDTFRTLHDLLGSGIRDFLETAGPSGRPIDLLVNGDSSAVIGLALRPLAKPVDSSSVSDAARRISGLPGWLRPPIRLSWGAPRLTDSERDDALDRLSPTPLFSQAERLSDIPVLTHFTPESGVLDVTVKERFARWIAHRFTRSAFHESIVGAVIKPILDHLAQMQQDKDPDLDALDQVREVRLAKITGSPPYEVRLLFIVPESGLPENGIALARLINRIREWFNPLAARLVAWDARHLYEITVGDYLDTERFYLDHYTYRGQTIRGLLPAPDI